ncbi:MAG: glutathione S-transferase family protein [Burkholderiaceae bacterium]
MKLYDFEPAPSAHRVRVFLSEKGISVPTVQLDVRSDEQFKEPFNSMNPFHCVPFLELDDGTVVAESVSICRYLEELNPNPPLFGDSPGSRAVIDMWNRRIELDGYIPGLHAVRNKIPMFAGKVIPGTRMALPQSPVMVERGTAMMAEFLGKLDSQLSANAFVAGDRVSIADITGWFTGNIAARLEIDLAADFPNVARWHREFSDRPSTRA